MMPTDEKCYRVTREVTLDLDLTVTEVARAFARMDQDQQARFLHVAHEELGRGLPLQLEWVRQSPYFTREARTMAQKLGEYAEYE